MSEESSTPLAKARARPRARATVTSPDLLECHNCLGLGHPHRLCPTPVGQGKGKAGADICENCRGKGHGNQRCTSKGGGQFTDPSLNKGSGQWSQGKGQGQFGQGKGNKGKGEGWGKGKGKGVYGVDDQAWEQDWAQQQAWAPQPDWPPSAAGFAAPTCMPWMDAAQASASAQDPWASWLSSGSWTPSDNSLTPKPRQISSMAMAKPKPPVTTHNMFSVLTIGSEGQKSTIIRTFGQIAKVFPQRPRRAKLSTSSSSAVAVSKLCLPSTPMISPRFRAAHLPDHHVWFYLHRDAHVPHHHV